MRDPRDELHPLEAAEFEQFSDNSGAYATRLVQRHFAGDYASMAAWLDAAKEQSPNDLAFGLYKVAMLQSNETSRGTLTLALFAPMALQVNWEQILEMFNYYAGAGQ